MKNRRKPGIVIIVFFLSIGYILDFFGVDTEAEFGYIPPPVHDSPIFPFWGATYADSDIVTPEDYSLFEVMEDNGEGDRFTFDWRTDKWAYIKVHLFNAFYEGGTQIEIRVNKEIESIDSARVLARKYSWLIGQLPKALHVGLKSAVIHRGNENFAAGNGEIMIYTERGEEYVEAGTIEEVLIHEGAHISLDSLHSESTQWLTDQLADSLYISTYAEENTDREDIAESFVLYVAVRYRSDRISEAMRDSVFARIPNRIAFFDRLELDMYPIDFN